MRRDLDMSSREIAIRLGVPLTRVYHYLHGMRRKGRPKKIVGFWWTEAELAFLRELYPLGSREEIHKALPLRHWTAIERKASEIGLKRHPNLRRRALPKEVHQIVGRLRELRIEKKLPVTAIAEKTGFCRQRITAMELGHCQPSLRDAYKWAAALGYSIILMPMTQTAPPPAPSLPAPARGFSLFDQAWRPPVNQPWRRHDMD